MVHRFHYLKYALAILLVFIGSKIFLADLMGFPAASSRRLGPWASPLPSVQRHRLFLVEDARASDGGAAYGWRRLDRRAGLVARSIG
jgi:hypothetical protein